MKYIINDGDIYIYNNNNIYFESYVKVAIQNLIMLNCLRAYWSIQNIVEEMGFVVDLSIIYFYFFVCLDLLELSSPNLSLTLFFFANDFVSLTFCQILLYIW